MLNQTSKDMRWKSKKKVNSNEIKFRKIGKWNFCMYQTAIDKVNDAWNVKARPVGQQTTNKNKNGMISIKEKIQKKSLVDGRP